MTGHHIVIADGERLVQMDDMAGTNWLAYGSQGSGVGHFNGPTGIAVDSHKRIYVADYFNDRIVRIDNLSGAGWVSLGTAGNGVKQFQNPYKIAIDKNDRAIRRYDRRELGSVRDRRYGN